MACLSANSAWALGEVKKAPHVATEFEKKTMVNLIMRYWPEPNGEVLLAARDVGCLARHLQREPVSPS